MKYGLHRRCNACKNTDIYTLSKHKSAFEQYDSDEIWDTPCKKCGSTDCLSLRNNRPEIDQELMTAWSTNADLHFLSMDEELILAEVEVFPFLLKTLDSQDCLPEKKVVLLQAACILLYDNIVDSDDYSEESDRMRDAIANVILPELLRRKKDIASIKEYIPDYIQEEVFPELGLGEDEFDVFKDGY